MKEYYLQRRHICLKLSEVIRDNILALSAVTALICVSANYLTGTMIPGLVEGLAVLTGIFVIKDKNIRLSLSIGVLFILYATAVMGGPSCSGEASFKDEVFSVQRIERRLDLTSRLYLRSREYGRVILNMDMIPEDISTGDILIIDGSVRPPEGPTNPGEFDYKKYLRSMGIGGILYPDDIRIREHSGVISLMEDRIGRYFFYLRVQSAELFGEYKGESGAVFTGDTSLISDKTRREFDITGLSHLLAVSGTHFSGFLMGFPLFADITRMDRKKEIIFQLLLCLFLGSFTGWSGSVTRAAFMSMVSCLCRDPLSGMSLAVLVIGASDPYLLVSRGFLMSFSCGLSVRFLGPRLRAFFEEKKVPGAITAVFVPVIAGRAGMLPFCLFTGSRTGFFTIPILWAGSFLASCACVFYIPSVILSLMFGDIFILPAKLSLVALLRFVSLSTDLIGGSQDCAPFILPFAFVVLMILAGKGRIRRFLLRMLPLILALSIALEITEQLQKPLVTLVFIDVGQGDSCLITDGDISILIDGGRYEYGRTVSSVLDYYLIDKVDIAVMSHIDEDHSGGIRYLYEEGRIERVYTPAEDKAPCPSEDLGYGDELVAGEMRLRCIYPESSLPNDGGNEGSAVILMEVSGTGILFTGDIGFETESLLRELGLLTDIDILKVAHHGSRYSTSEGFLRVTSPELCIISVGRHNNYGHPAKETLERIASSGSEVLKTSSCGAVTVKIYKDRYLAKCFVIS